MAAKNSDPNQALVLAAVRSLVAGHRRLQDKVTGAIWLPQNGPGVALLEVVPSMPADARVDEPMEFLPSTDFRYGLRLYMGREEDFLQAMARNHGFAAKVKKGQPIPSNDVTKRLLKKAETVLAEPANDDKKKRRPHSKIVNVNKARKAAPHGKGR
jgi:hypothetical protein